MFDLNENKDLKDTEADIDKIFKENNIQVKNRQTTMNFRSRKSFLFFIESYESKRIFDIHEQNRSSNFSISIEY